MIPRLYEANTTNFESNGIGLLVDAYNWHIVEEYNGDFTCEFDYPADGINILFTTWIYYKSRCK